MRRLAPLGPPLALLALAAVALVLAYQVRPVYHVPMDDPFDHLYLADGFHEPEENPDGTFRWTAGWANVRIEGIGRQPLRLVARLASAGVDPQPQKTVQVLVRGTPVASFAISPAPTTFSADLPPDVVDPTTGNLDLVLTMPSFHVRGDPRELGVVAFDLAVEPAGNPRLILPPPLHLVIALAITLCLYAIAWRIGLGARARWAVGLLAAGAVAALYAGARPWFALYAADLLLAAGMTAGAVLLAWPLVVAVYRRTLPGFDPAARSVQALFGLFAAGLLLGWAGLLYPQSNPNDFLFHLHRFQEVQTGTLFFDNYVVSGVGSGFYPPAMYVLLLPLARLFDPFYVVRLAPVAFDFSLIFVVYYLARRYFPASPAAAPLAAALYTILPINALLLWWAHQTNGFGLSLLVWVLVLVLENYDRLTRPLVWIGLTILFFVLFLSHPGVLIWSLALWGALLVVFFVLRRRTGQGSYQAVGALAAALIVAGLTALALYYSHYLGSFGTAASARGDSPVDLGQTLGNIGNLSLRATMLRLTWDNAVVGDYAVWGLALLPIGLICLFRARTLYEGHIPTDGTVAIAGARTAGDREERAARFRWTLATWVAVALGFMAINILTTIPIRAMLLLWPVLALLDGLALGLFVQAVPWQAGWRRGAVGLLLAGTAAVSLYLWATANFWDLHPSHLYPHVF